MPTIAAANGPVYTRRRRLGVVGAAFVGSSLIAVMAPAHAQPADPGGSPPEVVLENYDSEVEPGEELEPNSVSISNNGDATICLDGLRTEPDGLDTSGLEQEEIEPGAEALKVATINGSLGNLGKHTITAVLSYSFADEEGNCPGPSGGGEARSDEWTIIVAEEEDPSPTPTPTETPTESPTETPTHTPTNPPTQTPPDDPPEPEPTESETERPSPTPTETPPDEPSGTPTEDAGGDGGESGGDGGGSGTTSPRSPDPRSDDPGPDVSDPPTSDATVPELPRDEADLPDVSPGEEDDLAELPTVSPESEEDELDQSEAAADHNGPASMAPAVLLAAFLLALLLATPLAPTRRVRLGILGYQGKRRKGRS